jgi:hypothetical protein
MVIAPIVQRLTWWEFDLAASVGLRRQIEAMRDQRCNQRQTAADDLLVNVIGACGEMAAAKACGVYWDGSVNASRARGDIGPGWQVRTAYRTPPGRLTIRPRDRGDDVFILVFAEAPWHLLVLGWITGDEGRRVGIVEGYNGHEPAWFVEPSALHPIIDLVAG